MTEGQLADIEREEAVLWTKVKSLEAHLNSATPTIIKELLVNGIFLVTLARQRFFFFFF